MAVNKDNQENENLDSSQSVNRVEESNEPIDFRRFQNMAMSDLLSYVQDNNLILNSTAKSFLLGDLLRHFMTQGKTVIYSGFLEIINNTYGFLRDMRSNFNFTNYDVYVNQRLINEHKLRGSDEILGIISNGNSSNFTNNNRKEEQKYLSLGKVLKINGHELNAAKTIRRGSFEDLEAEYPSEQIVFENANINKNYNLTCRMFDLIAPVGFGQRCLIVAPPMSGKTMLLDSMMVSVIDKYPDVKVIALLVGERPEEVTEKKRIAPKAEIVFATFDSPEEQYIRVTEMIGERARRLVESGSHVVIFVDSLTRMARACNNVVPSSGRVLSGGVEATALQKPKSFFGLARNTKTHGSVTIIATVLVETGSKMDDFIYEELKATGNSEIKLDRKLASLRLFPAIDVTKSMTRRQETFLSVKDNNSISLLRRFIQIQNLQPQDSLQFLLDKINSTANNNVFFEHMYSSAAPNGRSFN